MQENQPKKKKTEINVITILEWDGEHTGEKITNTGKRICQIEAKLDEENEETNIFTKTNQEIFFYHSNILWQENRSYLIYLTWYNLKFYQEYESTDPGEETNDKFDGKK